MLNKPSDSFEVLTTEEFLKDIKSILKIYPGFKNDIHLFIQRLREKPEQGNHLGAGLYKVRISITGKSSGKSYGARVIYAVISISEKIFLLRAYDKSEKKDLSKDELTILFKKVNQIKQHLFKKN